MIKVSILYPRGDGSHFDIEYYCSKHMPTVKEWFGDTCKGVAAEEAISSKNKVGQQPFHAIGHLYFDTLDQFNQAFSENAENIMKDVPNYTNVQPVIQIGEVKIA